MLRDVRLGRPDRPRQLGDRGLAFLQSLEQPQPNRLAEGPEPGVREPGEYASEHIAGSCLVPLSSLEAAASEVPRDRDIYLVCQTGNRAAEAAARLARLGYTRLHVVEGGLVAWAAAGHPVTRGERRVWALDRQVRFAAGSLVLAGALLALLAHPAFALLSAGVGAGLVFSAATNTCGMTLVLARMPWNRCAAASPHRS